MKTEITKKQEIINNQPKKPKYTISIIHHYGTGDIKQQHSQQLFDLDLDDINLLRDRLNKDFPSVT